MSSCYFYCPVEEICLSFIDVCDGYRHCLETGDDELLCDLPDMDVCPMACFCIGYFIDCLCPLVALWFIFTYKCMNRNMTDKSTDTNPSLSQASEAIISVLQGPYRDDEKSMTLYWEAMVSIRHLLITSMTLVPYASIQMIIITALSLVFLMQQIYMGPFHVKTSNDIEAVSMALLCMTSVINLLKACLTDLGVVPSGPSVPFFKSLEFCEKIFVLFIISFILVTEFKLRKKKRKENVP